MAKIMKDNRLDIRLGTEQKDVLARAAALLGLNLSDFVISKSLDAAHNILKEHTVINMSPRDLATFMGALQEESEPTAALKRAVERYNSGQETKG